MPPAVCPEIAEYKRLAAGQLTSVQKEAVLLHLEHCPACTKKLGALPDDDTLFGLLDQDTLAGIPGEQKIARLIHRLRGSRQGDDSTAPAHARTFAVPCPACGKSIRVLEESAGKKVKCPQCQQVVAVPAQVATGAAGQDSAYSPTVQPDPGAEGRRRQDRADA